MTADFYSPSHAAKEVPVLLPHRAAFGLGAVRVGELDPPSPAPGLEVVFDGLQQVGTLATCDGAALRSSQRAQRPTTPAAAGTASTNPSGDSSSCCSSSASSSIVQCGSSSPPKQLPVGLLFLASARIQSDAFMARIWRQLSGARNVPNDLHWCASDPSDPSTLVWCCVCTAASRCSPTPASDPSTLA